MNSFTKILLALILFMLSMLASAAGTDGVTQTDDQKYDGLKTNKLSDQDFNDAKDFHHDGLANEKLAEECAKKGEENKYKDLCNDKKTAGKGKAQWEEWIPIVSKAYATLGLIGVGGGNAAAGAASGASSGAQTAAKVAEYCRYVPIAVEVAVAGIGQANSNSIKQSYIEDPKKRTNQREMILATADAHKSRKTTSTIQTVGYGVTALCYTYSAIYGGGASDIINAAVSGVLATAYGVKASHHSKRVKLIKDIADELPMIGDCNPQTETNCFCNTESSKTMYFAQYQRFCIPEEYKNSTAENPISCVNANQQLDNACDCMKTNTCFQDKFKKMNPNMTGPGSILWSQMTNGLDLINSGDFDEAKLAEWQKGTKAMNDKAMKKLGGKVNVPKVDLSDENRKIASKLAKAGMPANIAAMVSQKKGVSAPGFANGGPALAGVKKGLKKNGIGSQNYARGRKRIRIHSGAKGTSNPKVNPYAKFMNLDKKKNANRQGAIEQLEFARKAQEEAEIVRAPGRSLFKIIDHRYKTTAWRKLKILEK